MIKNESKPSENDVNGGNERGTWKTKREFILTCLGYAIGIGNVWRFPYLCYRNGGGAFLVPYLIMLFVCGLPLYFMETSIGQFSSTGCITMFRMSPLFKGAGYAIIIVNIICTSYYSLILTYPLLFIVKSFGSILPWENCDNPWNTENCIKLTGSDKINTSIFDNSTVTTPADEFFHNKILEISSDISEIGSVVWPVFWGNAFSWAIVFCCIIKGVKSVGKVVYFTATFPFVILFVLFCRGITLPGAIDGIKFYIYPQWNQLTNLKVWADAAIQIFYSLGPGWGGIVNMSSFNKFKNNNLSDSILVPIVNCSTSIFAGFVVFSVVGFMAERTGLPVATVATGGPSLAFVTYPAAITMLPWPNFWSVIFFAMLFLLGIDSCFVQLEVILSGIADEYPSLRKRKSLLAFFSCVLFFLTSMICTTNGGMYVLQLMDWYAASIPVIMICLIEVLIVGWIYGCENFVRDTEFMNGKKIHWIWPVLWKYVNPITLTFIFVTTIIWNKEITYKDVAYPGWSIVVGWGMCALSLLCIPIYMLYLLIFKKNGPISKRITDSIKPTKDWCPIDQHNANEWRNLINKLLPMDIKSAD
ncbi:sodium- and chloride-dependent glycine transporter 1-like [Arctopsyche grandis]|uniref:sodium- and chloride-dependent glycine transporter 1-like n=1 Tax=Arctopsyche grandis TaxID=121162 RepID=UPI00406D6813